MLKDIFQAYLNRLVDLSSKNRSLYLPKLVPSQMLDLKDLDFLNHHHAFGYIEALLGKKKEIDLIPQVDPRNSSINELSKKISRIQSLAQTAESETGEKSTFVAWPFVEGKLVNGQVIRCPLIFFPVTIELKNNFWKLKRSKSDLPILNKTFLLGYQHAYGKNSDGEIENPFEDFPEDATAFLNALYDLVKAELQVNFTSNLYEKTIAHFPESQRSLDENNFKLGELRLKPYATLGLFSQKTGFLIQDYEQLLNQEEGVSLEELFNKMFAPDQEGFKAIREDQLYNCFPVDAYQEQVIKAVRLGKSVVVEGPPGTGKSQLICNLALDYISRGKNVLVVSQKRAALDVVYRRLAELGFENFLALVHDFRADKKALFNKIQTQIDTLDSYKEQNRSIDAIQLERQFFQLSKTIENHVEFFNDFRKALFNTEECAVPIKELYLECQMNEDHFDMNQYYKKFSFDKVNGFLRNLKIYGIYYQKYQLEESFWLHRVNFSLFSSGAQKRLEDIFDEINTIKKTIALRFKDAVKFDITHFFSLFEQKDKLRNLSELLIHKDTQAVFEDLIGVDSEKIDLLWLEQKMDTVRLLLSEFGVEWFAPDDEVEALLELSLAYKGRGKGVLERIIWPWTKKKFSPIIELMEKNGLEFNDHGNEVLLKKLENRLNINHQITLLSGKEWLKVPDKPFDFATFNHFSQVSINAVKAKFLIQELGQIGEFLIEKSNAENELYSVIDFLFYQFEHLESRLPHWTLFLSKIQIQHLFLSSNETEIENLRKDLRLIFDDLVAFDTLKEQLLPDEIELIEKLWNSYPNEPFEHIQRRFLAGLRLSWIAHIEKKYPVLKEVSTPKAILIQEELMDAIMEKWKLSGFISGLRLREQSLKDLKYNRLGNLVSFRELSHQVKKKRSLWTIKKILESFESDVFQLVPCWLASPETVSALFPLKQSFDLVIFDEASQCFVERGLPAMLRGKQVVIAGDSQQLQPFDLYQTRIEEIEDDPDLEIDSLLEISSRYFEKYWLQGHYRSAQLSLIEFSNTFFYEEKLSMLPDRKLMNEPETPFTLIKTDGTWEHQTNLEEAEATLEEVINLQEKYPLESIGIITFNFFQMELIKGMIQKETRVNLEHVWVKNIENVQGDEFDRVIFSIGYAKNKSGRLISNFGALAKKGGMNRLNVAVTRARKSISLVTSLSSRDFKENHLKNKGIELLKNYIEFVEKKVSGKIHQKEVIPTKGFQYNWYLKNRLMEDLGRNRMVIFSESKWMDLALIENNQFVAALLTDDDRMYMAMSAKEAFAYHTLQLKKKNWPYQLFFTRQYWMGKSI
ncbi:MAG: AAA domain-containing protein [Cecembia sp.]